MVASMTSAIEGSGCSTPRIVVPRRLVADDEGIGLRAMQEPERHAGEGRVEQRALALDHVPVVGIVGRG